MKKIIVIFKTHLDLGFTDLAENVLNNYRERYLPGAMEVARQLRGEKGGFVWTTGSWLIQDYLDHGRHPELLEDAIVHGEIRWHGLPFTTHTELMDRELFHCGLGISHALDARFGMRTIAAKLTDVPGHTRGMVPLLSRAGIRFLHIGVNPASTPPDVPELFRWQAPGGEEITVMYNHDYGQMTPIGDSGNYVYFAHTGDNHGPQSPEDIRKIYRMLQEQCPGAELIPGTLEDLARAALEQGEKLPVVQGEIGDTWIHGTGSDPGKVSAFRGLLRFAKSLPEEEREGFYRELLPVPEHTWGLDEKTCLGRRGENGFLFGDHENFERGRFEAVRTSPQYRRLEASWKEQRGYLEAAVERLQEEKRRQAEAVMGERSRSLTDLTGFSGEKTESVFEIGGYRVMINPQGAVCFLEKAGTVLADENHLLGEFLYEVFSEKEYERFREQYVTSDAEWALEDFGKIGMGEAVERGCCFKPKVCGLYRKDREVVIRMTLPGEAVMLYGGMELLEQHLTFGENRVDFDFAWFGKHASRVAEASWLRFSPPQRVRGLEKLGQWIAPGEIIDGGNKRLHAVGEGVRFETALLSTQDAPLVNLGEPSLLTFSRENGPEDRGVCINLHNNVWGTNFVMWYDEDARFRCSLISDSCIFPGEQV